MSACFWNVPSSTNWTPRGWMFRGFGVGVRRVRGGEKKTKRRQRAVLRSARRARTTNEKETNLSCPRPGVVGMQWLSSPESVANYPVTEPHPPRKRRRAARETRREARRARSCDTKCRSGEGVAAIRASAFQRPTFRMASIKIATRNEHPHDRGTWWCGRKPAGRKKAGGRTRRGAVR